MGAPVQNPNDGTTLGTAEVIADEYIDPTTGGRYLALVPITAYKLPRSKIAVGPYGQDGGDAMPDTPLAVESRAERWILEIESLRHRTASIAQFQKFAMETIPLCDSRGYDVATRGVR
jgi:hypothetical protein